MDARVQQFMAHMASVGAAETALSYAKWAHKAESWASATGQRITSRRLVYDWAAHLASDPERSKNTIKVACAALRRYLEWLTVHGYPVAAQVKPEVAPSAQPVRFTPTDSDLAAFLAAMESAREPYATLAYIMAGTGMRVSEAAALRDEDGRLQSGWIVFTLRKTKNMEAREVPLLPDYTDRFRRYLRERRPALVAGSERVARNGWLFPIAGRVGAPRGRDRPVSRQQVARELRLVGRKLGLPITPHALRRYYVTSMMRRGVPAPTIMKVIGHTNPNAFRRYYQPTAADLIDSLEHPREEPHPWA